MFWTEGCHIFSQSWMHWAFLPRRQDLGVPAKLQGKRFSCWYWHPEARILNCKRKGRSFFGWCQDSLQKKKPEIVHKDQVIRCRVAPWRGGVTHRGVSWVKVLMRLNQALLQIHSHHVTNGSEVRMNQYELLVTTLWLWEGALEW